MESNEAAREQWLVPFEVNPAKGVRAESLARLRLIYPQPPPGWEHIFDRLAAPAASSAATSSAAP